MGKKFDSRLLQDAIFPVYPVSFESAGRVSRHHLTCPRAHRIININPMAAA